MQPAAGDASKATFLTACEAGVEEATKPKKVVKRRPRPKPGPPPKSWPPPKQDALHSLYSILQVCLLGAACRDAGRSQMHICSQTLVTFGGRWSQRWQLVAWELLAFK